MKISYKLNLSVVILIVFTAFIINFVGNAGSLKEVSSENKKAYVAIIIDDFGGGAEGTEEMLKLPVKFTGAVMPFMEQSSIDAARLKEGGNSVLVHLPMEAKKGKRSWLGEKAVLTGMSDDEIRAVITEALSGDCAIGVNNHMGSKAMEDERIMNILFDELSKRDLIFVDSMTTPESKSSKYGEKYGVRVIKRDVFLDSTQDKEKIKGNLKKAGEIAKEKGYAVCIGHVGAEGGKVTAEAIKETYRELEEDGVEFVTISRLISYMK